MKIRSLLESAVHDQVFPGAAVGLCNEEEQHFWCAGNLTYDSSSPVVTPETLYDVASITKTIPTALLAWKLIEQGKLSFGDKVQHFLPEWQGRYKNEVLLWHLLAHALRYENTALSHLSSLPAEQLKQRVMELEIIEPPGTSFFYVNTSSILLTWIIERVTRQSLDQLAKKYFWQPAKLTKTSFSPLTLREIEIAPTEKDGRESFLQGLVHDESARVLSAAGSPVGSAGLFSCAADLTHILQCLLRNNGMLFTPTTVERMFTPSALTNATPIGLGWELNAPWMGVQNSLCFGKTGFTGCCITVLPENKKALVFLSNAVHPQRYTAREKLDRLRKELVQQLEEFSFSHNT